MAFAPMAATRRLLSAPPDDQREVNWGFKDIAKLVGLSILYSLVANLLLGPVFKALGVRQDQVRIALAEFISLALLYLTHTRYRFWPSAHYFGLTRDDFRSHWQQGIRWGIVIKIGMVASAALAVAALLLMVGHDHDSSLLNLPSVLLRAKPGSLLWLTDTMRAVIFAPLTEEILCRGILYGWLASKYGAITGRIASSLVFAALHGSVAALLPTFLVGFALALLYERTRSLAPCIVAHGVGNLISVVLTMFV